MQHHSISTSFDDSAINSFVILSDIERSIKQKIEAVGTPLKDWDINIYRGILTGYNEAFIIDGKTKDKLIAKSSKNAEIIRPILRGRDIKRYGYEFADLWLICTHNGTEQYPAINIDDYPDIKEYLNQFITQLSKRQDKGVTPYNLRSCAYIDDFSRPKVMWKIIGCNLNFFYDTNAFYCNNAVNIMTGHEFILLQFIGLMNSKLFDWYLKLTTNAEVQGGGIQMYSTTLEELPIKLDFKRDFNDLVIERASNKLTDREIDEYVYKLYNLDKEEVNFLKSLKK